MIADLTMAPKCTIDQIKDVLSDLQTQLEDIKQAKKDSGDLESELDDTTQSKKDEEPVEEEKRQSCSWWGRIRETVIKGFRVKKETSTCASDSGEGSQSGSGKSKGNMLQDQEEANLEILKLQNDIRQMKAAFENLAHFQSNVSKSLETEVPLNKLKAIMLKTDSAKSRARDLKEIRRKVLNLKGQIPSLPKKQSSIGLSITDSQTAEENGQIVETGSDIFLPGLHVSYDFRHSPAFEEVVDKFCDELEFPEKLCLLSFSVFPENKEVERTMLMYWWIGEGFISYQDSENTVTRILDEFSRKGLLVPVEDERKLKPSGYKMEPHVHAAVIYLASRMDLFELYSAGKPKMQKSGQQNVCLVRRSSLQPEAKASKMELETLNSVFNSSERYPDFTFKWFLKMESLKVLYLGRWERTAQRHIEVESTDFLKYLTRLKKLRLASFQGISRIENLQNLNCSLPELVILDLRACYNLEVLPKDIGSLESLIYLDVSECYMLDRMPQGISRLKTLQVLKGFVISQSDDEKDCAVRDLVNLRKLSITVNRYPFMVDDFMESLKGLQQLESLKIAWGAQVHKKGQTSEDKSEDGNKKANLEARKKKDEDHAESLKSDKVVEGDEEKADQKEGKKQDSLKSEKKASPSSGETGTIQSKPEDAEGKSQVAGEGDKGKAATEEGKKQDKVEAEKSRSENDVDGVNKASPSSNTVENKQEEKGDGEKEKVNTEEGNMKDEVKEVGSKPDDAEGDEKTSPPQESKDTVKSKPDDHQRGDKQEEKRDGEKDKTEGEKKDEVKAENSEPDKVDAKTSPPQESKDNDVTSKPDDHQRGDKQEEKRDEDKDKIEEGKTKDEVKAENSEPDKVDEKTSPPQESKDTKPDDHQRGDIQEEKRDEERDIIEEGKKKDKVKAENSKADKVDKKTSPSQQSKDTIQSKPDDPKENSNGQEKGDGENIKAALKKPNGEAKTQKLDKNKLGKKVSFSEESRAPIQKKPADMKKESPEMAPTSRSKRTATKRLFNMMRTETKKLGKGKQEDTETDTSKLPSSLKKLELECYPEKEPPSWLNPKTLDSLEKLSIKGGNLSSFSDKPSTAKNKCNVQILRLKYLHKFKAEWKELHALFPKLKLLEKYKCPEVTFCPTDGNGVWRSEP